MEIPILFESHHLLAIDKPCGLVVERDPYGYPSVEEWARGQYPFAGIVHRLDRPVSGLLLIAKKKSALKALNRQFEARTVEKTYLAIVEKALPLSEGSLEHWLARDRKGQKALVAEQGAKGAFLCQLEYKVLETLPSGLSLLEIRPLTGKFHQIRAQLAASGCPILGDEKYGAALPYRPDGIGLHAWKLSFMEPQEGRPLSLVAPVPGYAVWREFPYFAGNF